jgi:hypothetical protein
MTFGLIAILSPIEEVETKSLNSHFTGKPSFSTHTCCVCTNFIVLMSLQTTLQLNYNDDSQLAFQITLRNLSCSQSVRKTCPSLSHETIMTMEEDLSSCKDVEHTKEQLGALLFYPIQLSDFRLLSLYCKLLEIQIFYILCGVCK